jgi:AcrR family transcriptional regulator
MGAKRRTTAAGDLMNKGERTRSRIKEAFAELLESKSFASITIADICRASDVTVGGFYFHFASQDELLNEVMWQYADDLVRAVDAAIIDGPRASLAASVCTAFLRMYSAQSGLARTFQQLVRIRSDYTARWRAAREPRIARLGQILQAGRPELKANKARLLAHALVMMIACKLDLSYPTAKEGSRGNRPALRTIERDLVLLWTRMVDGAAPA